MACAQTAPERLMTVNNMLKNVLLHIFSRPFPIWLAKSMIDNILSKLMSTLIKYVIMMLCYYSLFNLLP